MPETIREAVDVREGQITPDYNKWRNALFKMNLGIAGFVLLLEIAIFILLYLTDGIEQTLPEYLRRFLFMPTLLNSAAVGMQHVIMRMHTDDNDLENHLVIITMILICTVAAATHYVFSLTLIIFCIPILASVIFCDKSVSVNAAVLSVIGLSTALICRYCYRYPKADGQFIPDIVLSLSLLVLSEAVSQLIIRLIKEQNEKLYKATADAQAAQAEALKANLAKSSFLANMSHEIRTPINAVLGMNEMILREEQDKQIREYAMNIHSAGNSLLSIINDVLDITKIESGKIEILEAKYDISSLINDSYNMVWGRAKDKGIDIAVKSEGAIPKMLYGDETHIRQMIVNLLTNAVKYTEKGTVTMTVSGETKFNGFLLSIAVADTGIGISNENLDKLFDQFQRVDLEHNRTIEGTGLGLAITRKLAELMGGKITVESELGKGSVFTLNIPQKIIDHTDIGTIEVSYDNHDDFDYKQSFEAPDARILVVDDVVMNLKIIVNMLKQTKVRIDTAESGSRCLELAMENKYDIIFMDHMMPEMDGVQTYKNMRDLCALNVDTPVIMLTANALAGVKDEYLTMGFSDYLSKPVRSDKLEEMIVRYLPSELLSTDTFENASDEISVSDEKPAEGGSLSDIMPEMDTEAALGYCCGSEEFLAEILRDFAESDRIDKLEAAYSSDDFENYRILAHSLKSASLTIGLSELSEKAKASEFALKENDTEFAKAHHAELMEMLRDVTDRLIRYCESR